MLDNNPFLFSCDSFVPFAILIQHKNWRCWPEIQTLAPTGAKIRQNNLQDHSALMDCCLSQYNVPGSEPIMWNVPVCVLLTLRFSLTSSGFGSPAPNSPKLTRKPEWSFSSVDRWRTKPKKSPTYTVDKEENKETQMWRFHSGMEWSSRLIRCLSLSRWHYLALSIQVLLHLSVMFRRLNAVTQDRRPFDQWFASNSANLTN